jgi:hypothetical protein
MVKASVFKKVEVSKILLKKSLLLIFTFVAIEVILLSTVLPIFFAKPSDIPNTTPISTDEQGVQPVWSANGEISNIQYLGIRSGFHGNGSPKDMVTLVKTQASRVFQLRTDDGRIEFDFYPDSLIQDDFYFSYWVYLPSSLNAKISEGQWLTIFQVEGSILPNWDPIYGICISSWQADNHIILLGTDNNGNVYAPNGVLADSGKVMSYDKWVHLEFYCHIAASGSFQAWMDGVKLWSITGINNTGLKQNTLYFMPCIYGTNGVMYIDNLSLYNVNMNGKAA